MRLNRLQPLLLIMEDGTRYNCDCGALAVITRMQRTPGSTNVRAIDYCQDCWEKEQEGQSVSQQETPHKWQPVILILDRRLECHCGALAIFITGEVSEEEYNCMDGVDVWCQDCFDKAQKEQEGGEQGGRQTE